jgi:peptide deformylase
MSIKTGPAHDERIGVRRPVLVTPDLLLRRVARRCPEVDSRNSALVADLLATMRSNVGCVGLAAPQIGALARVVVVDVTTDPRASDAHGTILLVNPEIVFAAGAQGGREGCLSLPGLTASIQRAANVVVAGLSVRGEDVLIEARGFEARVLQHELDHLDGVLIHDRVESLADLSPRTQPFRQLPGDEDPADVPRLPVDLNAPGSTAKGRRRA